jgi:hypothetical protein
MHSATVQITKTDIIAVNVPRFIEPPFASCRSAWIREGSLVVRNDQFATNAVTKLNVRNGAIVGWECTFIRCLYEASEHHGAESRIDNIFWRCVIYDHAVICG